jgi:hypothetical protein
MTNPPFNQFELQSYNLVSILLFPQQCGTGGNEGASGQEKPWGWAAIDSHF